MPRVYQNAMAACRELGQESNETCCLTKVLKTKMIQYAKYSIKCKTILEDVKGGTFRKCIGYAWTKEYQKKEDIKIDTKPLINEVVRAQLPNDQILNFNDYIGIFIYF